MAIVLLMVGLLATAAGFVTIGFGIPINAFSLGNTLIVAGTIAVAGGLVLIGLAAVIGQLRRIAEALQGRAPLRAGRGAETVETLAPGSMRMPPVAAPSPLPGRMPMPPRPPEMPEPPPPEPALAELRQPEPRYAEPRFVPVAHAEAPEPPGPLDWLRAKRPGGAPARTPSQMSEAGMVEVPDEAPLSPRSPLRQPAAPMAEAGYEQKAWPPGRGAPAPAEVQPAPRADHPMPRATPTMPVEQPKEPEKPGFDALWERSAPAPAGEGRAEAVPEFPLPLRPREARPADRRSELPPKPMPERGPAILKSGVIDGMPYTLYADGSIEAELPQGTVKFASVDALRAHLEKQG
jgi:hypothetical protein